MLSKPRSLQQHTNIELIQMYQNLLQKRRDGKFSHTSAIGFAAIKSTLKTRGFVLSDDENTWQLPT